MNTPSSITGIDTHAHIFRTDLSLVANRRYAPQYNALPESYLNNLDSYGLSHGVLVQPSFLGTDNSYIISVVKENINRLRGVVVVEKDITDEELDEMNKSGIVGIRLNLIGKELEDYSSVEWQNFFRKIAKRNWSVEIHRSIEDMDKILPDILKSGVDIVIDHFARAESVIDAGKPSHRMFLALLRGNPIWIKLSGTYRTNSTVEQARSMIDVLRDAYGSSDYFLWGSDWPHTQFEDQVSYEQQYKIMEEIIVDPNERKKILIDNAARCFNFDVSN
ncbi:amidohydrolase [Vibrio sp. HA2012]|nr:amidohydrolase [Vibrio sp. HA2012]